MVSETTPMFYYLSQLNIWIAKYLEGQINTDHYIALVFKKFLRSQAEISKCGRGWTVKISKLFWQSNILVMKLSGMPWIVLESLNGRQPILFKVETYMGYYSYCQDSETPVIRYTPLKSNSPSDKVTKLNWTSHQADWNGWSADMTTKQICTSLISNRKFIGTDSFLRLTLFANMLLDCLPAGCSHDALVLRTAALGVVVVLHAKVVSHLMRHRCGYQSHQPIIVLSTTTKTSTLLCVPCCQ